MRRFFSIVMSMFIALFLCTGCSDKTDKPGNTKQKKVELTYSIFFPPAHAQCKAAIDWAKEVEKRSEGAIKINVFPGGTLTKANECYDGVTTGISDIGMSCFAYTRGRFPVMEAVDLPLGYDDGMEATKVANEYFLAMNPKELKGVHVLYLHAHGPGLLHTTKKPVNTLDDLSGLKIRSTGLSAKVASALGATPVAMPQGGTYEALEKGVVEGTFAPIETLKGWKQAETIDYTTNCHGIGYTTTMFVVMNKNKWNSLTPELQKIFTDVSSEWITVHGNIWDDADAAGRAYTEELGNTIIELPDDQTLVWENAVDPVIRDYETFADSKGIDGKKSVSVLRDLIARH